MLASLHCSTYFNPRPPRGGRRLIAAAHCFAVKFQSTPSARRATKAIQLSVNAGDISIHALREEGDFMCTGFPTWFRNFNPRPPRGGRRQQKSLTQPIQPFQSTPSARRATGWPSQTFSLPLKFQSTPSARRATCRRRLCPPLLLHFNPRPPRGGRPHVLYTIMPQPHDFNPRPPRGGRQQKRRKNPPRLFHYTHLCTI